MTTMTVAFDTLNYANKLKQAGVDSKIAEVQAELQAEVLSDLTQNHLATKGDMAAVKGDVAAVKAELKAEITAVRAELKMDIANLKHELLRTLGVVIVGCSTVLGILIAFMR